jgi:nitrite reductase/ring-hydroxylating ferredoxin subunit
MPEFRRVCKVADVKNREGYTVQVGEKLIAVFQEDGQ